MEELAAVMAEADEDEEQARAASRRRDGYHGGTPGRGVIA
jgi:hypothetical protein